MNSQECATTKICNVCSKEKDVSVFYVRNGFVQKYCLECKRAKNREHYKNNPDAYKQHAKTWASENKEKRRLIVNSYDARNRDKIKSYHSGRKIKVNAERREAYKNNPESIRANANKSYHANKHLVHNKAMRALRCAERQRDLAIRTPKWANLEDIKRIYINAQSLNKDGIRHNVDHIIPLKGKLVSGLHCESNLRIITAFENQSKGNKLVDDIVRPY
jgi:hypothetical protein